MRAGLEFVILWTPHASFHPLPFSLVIRDAR